MTYILKLALCLLLSIGFFSGVQAQEPVTTDSTTNMMKNNNKWSNTMLADTFPRADRQTAFMHDQLKLSPNQRTRLFDIHMRYADQSHLMLDSLGRANNLAASRDKMTMLRKQQDAEIKNLLTTDQWRTWENYQTEQNKQMNSTHPNDPANTMKHNNKWSNTTMTDTFPRADQQNALMHDQLKLSPSQRTRINEINMRYADQYHVMDSLGRSNKPAASRDKMTRLRKQQDAEIKKVLTIDQWKNWENYQTEQNKNMNRNNPNDPANIKSTHPNDPTNMNRPNPNDPTKPNKKKDDKTKMNNPSSPKPSQTSPPGGNQ